MMGNETAQPCLALAGAEEIPVIKIKAIMAKAIRVFMVALSLGLVHPIIELECF
jgi:hypothetical protein